jgi:hypothetical protein
MINIGDKFIYIGENRACTLNLNEIYTIINIKHDTINNIVIRNNYKDSIRICITPEFLHTSFRQYNFRKEKLKRILF